MALATIVRTLPTAAAAGFLLASCRGEALATVDDGAASPTGPPVSTSLVSPQAETAPGLLTQIPADVRLPHQSEWSAFTSHGGFPIVCLDPPAALADVVPTDSLGRYDDGNGGNGGLEALAVYADGPAAAEAMDDFRAQIEACGGRQMTEAGTWMTWHTSQHAASGVVTEGVYAYVVNSIDPGSAANDSFTTIVRVRNAIFEVESRSAESLSDASALAAAKQSGEAAVTAYLPTLCLFSAAGS